MDPITMGLILGGGTIGAIGGGVGAYNQNKSQKAQLDALLSGNKELQQLVAQNLGSNTGMVTDAYKGTLNGYDPESYINELKSRDYSKYDITAPGDFEFDLAAETQAQLNPALDEILKRSTGQIEASSANAGKLFSSATGKNIARSTTDLTAQEWSKARDAAQTVGQNKYQQFIDKFNNAIKVNEFNRGNTVMGQQGQTEAFNIQNNANQNQLGQLLGLNTTAQGQDLQLQSEYLTNKATRDSMASGTSAALQGILGGFSGGASAGGTVAGGLK
jgi:hypothetical protein